MTTQKKSTASPEQLPPSRGPTVHDVAALAGVAPASVSNVLTGRRQVTEDLRQRVLAAIATLGYRPNQLASSLRLRRSHTIGIVVPDLTNPFFAALVHHLEDLAATDGYEILLASSNEDEAREMVRLQTLQSRRIDGLILAPARDDTSSLAKLQPPLPPTVLMDRGFEHDAFDTVAIDNAGAAHQGCRHLLDLGHRDIAFVVSCPMLANMQERIRGYRSALAESGLAQSGHIISGDFDVGSCQQAVEQVLRHRARPTAIFTANYVATLGAIKAIRNLGLEIPRDVSLLGFDDADWMAVLRPYLSVIVQPVEQIAASVWQLLTARLRTANTPPEHIRLPCSMALRDSTQSPLLSSGRSRRPASARSLPLGERTGEKAS
jgi:LacI family transcriptional regulator